ncbi:hypothetical protein RJT34_16744 [Clitoria ternatea]|uniref:14-3-3 domain-containing protein n=1 Tax=Clitoria ternatea TaxID=43366 RepID=A0AAN9PE04_CLITE
MRWAAINVIGQLSTDLGPDLQGDYYRYLTEFKSSNERKEAADQSTKAYQGDADSALDRLWQKKKVELDGCTL